MTSTSTSHLPCHLRARGFTLLELMVALALFSLGVVSLLVVKSNSLREATMAQRLHLAHLLGSALMEDLILGLHEFEDAETGDVYALEGEMYESFKTPEYDGFVWEIGVLEEVLAGSSSDENDEEDGGSVFDIDKDRDRNRERQVPTSRRASPGEEGKGKGKRGGGGGLFGGGDEESDEGEEVLALRLRVVVYFPVGDSDEILELETLAPFVMDDVFEGIDAPESSQTEDGGQDRPGQPGRQQPTPEARERTNSTLEEIFGDG